MTHSNYEALLDLTAPGYAPQNLQETPFIGLGE